MDFYAKERFISQISSGLWIIDTNINNLNTQLVLKSPTSFQKAFGTLVYDKAYKHALSMGILTENDYLEHLLSTEQWTYDDEAEIKTLQNNLYKISKNLISLILNKKQLNTAKLMLRKTEKALSDLIGVKNILLQNTAENLALLAQQKYILSQIAYTVDGDLFWKNKEEFDSDQRCDLINYLVDSYFSYSRIRQGIIREIARTNPWRKIWVSAKASNNLFERSPDQFTDNQLELVYWSNTYDSVFEAYERPSKTIVEDDDLLDSWFIQQSEKIEEKTNKNFIEPKNSKGSNGRKESFIITDKESAGDVYNANDSTSRAIIKARNKVLETQGKVKEQDMPDSQQEIRLKANQAFRNKVRRK